MTELPIRGRRLVSGSALETDGRLSDGVDRCVAFAATLPPK